MVESWSFSACLILNFTDSFTAYFHNSLKSSHKCNFPFTSTVLMLWMDPPKSLLTFLSIFSFAKFSAVTLKLLFSKVTNPDKNVKIRQTWVDSPCKLDSWESKNFEDQGPSQVSRQSSNTVLKTYSKTTLHFIYTFYNNRKISHALHDSLLPIRKQMDVV